MSLLWCVFGGGLMGVGGWWRSTFELRWWEAGGCTVIGALVLFDSLLRFGRATLAPPSPTEEWKRQERP